MTEVVHEQEPLVLEGTPVPDGAQHDPDIQILTGSPIVAPQRQLEETDDERNLGRAGRRLRNADYAEYLRNVEYDRDGRRVAPRPPEERGRCYMYSCCCNQQTKYGRLCSLLALFGFITLTGFMRYLLVLTFTAGGDLDGSESPTDEGAYRSDRGTG